MVWIDTLPTIFGGLAAMVTLLAAVVGSVRWVVRRELQPVRGEVHALSERVDSWIAEHQRRHDDEQAAVASAFERSGMHPPDGWGRRRAPPRKDAGEGQQQ